MPSAAATKPTGILVFQSGKRVSRARLLEEQATQLVEQMRSLVRQNALLRKKEAMQMRLLNAYQDSLHHFGVLLVQTAEEGQDVSVLTAAMMDLQAQELLQQLKGGGCGADATNSGSGGSPPFPLPTTTTCGSDPTNSRPLSPRLLRSTSPCSCGACDACRNSARQQSPAAAAGAGQQQQLGGAGGGSSQHAAIPPAAHHDHDDPAAGAADTTAGVVGGGGSVSPAPPPAMRRTQRLWASVTPGAVLALKGISTRELAEKYKSLIMRMALIRECCRTQGLGMMMQQTAGSLEAAAEDFGLLTMLAWVAADKQLLELQCLNLETMQPDEPPKQLWPDVVAKLDLHPEQCRQAYLAFDCYRSRRTALLQQQEQLIRQLQELLGDDEGHGLSDGPAAAGCCQRTNSTTSTGNQGLDGAAAATTKQEEQPAAAAAQLRDDSARSSRSCSSSSTGSHKCLSLAGLGAIMQAEEVCDQLARNTRLQREYSRQMVYLYIDLLTVEQHVTAVMACYPHNVKAPAVLACIYEQEHERLQAQQPGGA